MALRITLPFQLAKETKNTFRYGEVDKKGNFLDMPDAVVGTIYVKQDQMAGEAPKKIKVSITA